MKGIHYSLTTCHRQLPHWAPVRSVWQTPIAAHGHALWHHLVFCLVSFRFKDAGEINSSCFLDVSTFLFAVSPYFWMGLSMRLLGGTTNANAAVTKAVLADLTRGDRGCHRFSSH